MALEALKILLEQESQATMHSLHVDMDSWETMPIKRSHDPKCRLCVEQESDFIYDEEPEYWNLPYESLQTRTDAIWIDIREEDEARTSLPLVHRRPLSRMDARFLEEYRGRSIILLCEKGIRSRKLARKLREGGIAEVYSLRGGLAALSQPPMLARCGVAPT